LAAVLNEGHNGEDGHAEEYVLHAWICFEGAKFGNPWERMKQPCIFPVTKAPFTTQLGIRPAKCGLPLAVTELWLNGRPTVPAKVGHSFTMKGHFSP